MAMINSQSSSTEGLQTWFLGLVGFVCPHWRGVFYPSGMADDDRLAYLADYFNAVEINTTFYAPPSRKTLRRWARAKLQFCVKMPRDVTHGLTPIGSPTRADGPPPGHLLHDRTRETTTRFLETLGELGDKLGVVLIQFPPGFTSERQAELARFLDRLPRSVRIAVELRHDSWWTSETASVLRDRGVSWVVSDQSPRSEAMKAPGGGSAGPIPRLIVPTADFLYVRWLGKHGQFRDHRREHFDPTTRLEWWARRLREGLSSNRKLRTIYGFFDDDLTGHAPATARRFADLIGVPRPAGNATWSNRPGLFDASVL
jgi:uncharacterized protein YecE (DUF72 family)